MAKKPAKDFEYQIARLNLMPGDILVVKLKTPCTQTVYMAIAQSLRRIIGPNPRFLILDHTLDIAVLTREQIEAQAAATEAAASGQIGNG
jgi:hypothetical protein